MIQVNVEPEQINKMVADAILQSSLGEALKATIDEQVSKLSTKYPNPFEQVINNHIQTEIRRIVMTDYQDQFEELIKNHLTAEVIGKIVDKTWENMRF